MQSLLAQSDQVSKSSRRVSRLSIRCVCGLAAAALLLSAGAFAADAGGGVARIQLQAVPAVVARAQYLGPHATTSRMDVLVSLKLRNAPQLDAFLRNVQNPGSAQYHHFLTPQQFAAQYGPSPQQVQQVEAYLRAQGLQVTSVASNRLLIRATGTGAVLQRAFNTRINDYSHNGRHFYAPAVAPSVPAALASMVQSVIGLSTAAHFTPHLVPRYIERTGAGHGILAGRSNTQAHGAAAANSTPSGFSPQQIATAYNWPSITSTASGSGVTIAIVTAESTNLAASDYDGFWNQYGLPTHTVNIINVDGSASATGGTDETTIDVERSGAMAPGATIDVYDANSASLTDFTDAYNQVVTANTAQVLSTSWGTAESNMSSSTIQADDNIFKQAVAQGISVFAAAGDNGSADSTSSSDAADYPASDPYVMACGGTSLTLGSSNTIASETAWSDTGGAQSSVFSEPSWQTGTGVPQNGDRNTSDMSMDADPNTGYSVLLSGSWAVYGGTSFVAPQLAGLWADGVAQDGGTRLGQADSAIYGIANTSAYGSDFHDITSGSNGAFSAGVGWDHPTGWGSPDATNLIASVVSAAGGGGTPAPTPTASNGAVSTNENTAVSGTLSASESGGAALSFAIVTQPAHGSVTITNTATGAFTYTPTTGYSGSDSFTFNATDASGNVSNTATESVTIKATSTAFACPSGYATYTGNLSGTGNDETQPNGNYYHAGKGVESGKLNVPSTAADFELDLYKWSNWYGWVEVAASNGGAVNQSVSYNGGAGYYIWDVYSDAGSGSYTFCLQHP